MSDAGHIAAEAAATAADSAVVMTSAVVPIAMEVVVMRVMPVIVAVITPTVRPVRIPAPIAIVVGITPIPVPAPIAAPIGTITPSVIIGRVVVPIEGVVAVYVDVGVATAVSVVVVIVVSRRGSLRAETLDACGKVGIVIRLSGGVHHTVGVGHRLSGLINGVGIVDVILAVRIVSLVVVFRVAADAGAHVRTVASGHLTA
jgi:hypothetical protein